MNLSNVFYFKYIVDEKYPDENREPINIQTVVEEVKQSLIGIPDDDFTEILISCFIPDLYPDMGKSEKLFTKLTELMVGDWWRRIGGSYNLPTKKSGTEDVELIYKNTSIVCDAKVFRLGRSQKAPNVKDFLKLASVALWIKNLKNNYSIKNVNQTIIGGLVTYSSLHEWERDSEVYAECTNHETPVVMLPYEVLSLLLKYKNRLDLSEFLEIWDYKNNNIITSRNKLNYWSYIQDKICNLLSLSIDEYNREIQTYHVSILEAVSKYRENIQQSIEITRLVIYNKLEKAQNIEELRLLALDEIENRDNAAAKDYLKHIDNFRNYRDIL